MMTTTMTTTTVSGRSKPPTQPDTMRAVTQHRYGTSEAMSIETIDRPTIGADQVLIEVHAAGLDRGTQHLLTGLPYLIRIGGYGLTRPKNPIAGLDVSGVVAEVGDDVTRFTVGDEVFGIADGSFAEFAAADESKLAIKPEGVSFASAAASAVSGITALQALTDVGKVEPGQRVLVIGASGGVGSFAVQLASTLGALVDGVAGTPNLGFVRSLGADQVFDHRNTDLTEIDQSYDLVLDIGGRNSIHKLRSLLTPKGTLVIVGGEDGNRFTGGVGRQLRAIALSPIVGHRLTTFMSKEHHSFIERLADHLASGAVKAMIENRFELENAADAMRLMESGATQGKSVIVVKENCSA